MLDGDVYVGCVQFREELVSFILSLLFRDRAGASARADRLVLAQGLNRAIPLDLIGPIPKDPRPALPVRSVALLGDVALGPSRADLQSACRGYLRFRASFKSNHMSNLRCPTRQNHDAVISLVLSSAEKTRHFRQSRAKPLILQRQSLSGSDVFEGKTRQPTRQAERRGIIYHLPHQRPVVRFPPAGESCARDARRFSGSLGRFGGP